MAQSGPVAGYYVVVAAYYSNGQTYAEKYAATFADKGYTGQYAFFPEKNMYFVHLNRYGERSEALTAMRKVRNDGVKEDAWVYVYKPENIEAIERLEPGPEPSNASSESETDNIEPEPEESSIDDSVNGPATNNPNGSNEPVEESSEIPADNSEPEPDPYEGMHPVFFKMHHGTSTELIEGKIQVIDPDKGRLIQSLDGNRWHYIDKPSNVHSEVQLIADLFGYRKVSHVIHLDEPEKDTTDYFIQVRNDSILVDFELVRYHVGDIFTMYNVYFFSHSAVMKPESIYELDQLLVMLNENSALKIVLHGHTNGNSAGDMKYKPEGDHNLFSMTGAEEKTASAKALSEERANMVRRYLIDKGIDDSRMEIKGWGGKRMLYKKTDPQAIKNVRVEIEIVEE